MLIKLAEQVLVSLFRNDLKFMNNLSVSPNLGCATLIKMFICQTNSCATGMVVLLCDLLFFMIGYF